MNTIPWKILEGVDNAVISQVAFPTSSGQTPTPHTQTTDMREGNAEGEGFRASHSFLPSEPEHANFSPFCLPVFSEETALWLEVSELLLSYSHAIFPLSL